MKKKAQSTSLRVGVSPTRGAVRSLLYLHLHRTRPQRKTPMWQVCEGQLVEVVPYGLASLQLPPRGARSRGVDRWVDGWMCRCVDG